MARDASTAPAGRRKCSMTPSPSHFTGVPPAARDERSTRTARVEASSAAAWSPCSSVSRV